MVQAPFEVWKTVKIAQYGLQYLLYTQDYLKSHCEQLARSIDQEQKHLDSLQLIAKRQRAKKRKLQRELDELGMRGHHLDLLGDVVKSESTQMEHIVSQLKQASFSATADKPPTRVKTNRSVESKLDELLESDFELSASHPADFRPIRHEEAKVAHIEMPIEEKYSKFSSPATYFKSDYSGKPLSELFSKDKLATSLSQDELSDNRLSASAKDWEPIFPVKR
mmetsp:Transcript_19129/g.34834  ORF Transcript_19129/g.34834 Transcript_19129/m.34834 type:complete len:222 (+) Transcript_19129:58-723(+)